MRDAAASRFAGINFTTTAFDVRYGAEQMLEHIDCEGELQVIIPGELIEYPDAGNSYAQQQITNNQKERY